MYGVQVSVDIDINRQKQTKPLCFIRWRSFLAGFLVYVISTVSNVIMWYQVQTIEWHLGAGRTEIMTRWQQIILFRNQYHICTPKTDKRQMRLTKLDLIWACIIAPRYSNWPKYSPEAVDIGRKWLFACIAQISTRMQKEERIAGVQD